MASCAGWLRVLWFSGAALLTAPVLAQTEAPPLAQPEAAAEPGPATGPAPSVPRDGFWQGLHDAGWETAGLFAVITGIGYSNWDWGSSEFHFNSERWFGMDTGSAGTDKFGHSFSAYTMAQFLSASLADSSSPQGAGLNGALISWGLMLYVETFDGYSREYGFSYEDMIANTLGVTLSYLRVTVPGLRDKLDYRMQYWPSKYVSGYRPLSDYNGQTYILALKLSGFDTLRATPWRFLELHAGYYTRNFRKAAFESTATRRAGLYLGFSINFTQVLVAPWRDQQPRLAHYAATTLEYVQPPFTSVRVLNWERHRRSPFLADPPSGE